jgi:hypothetical protein
MTICSRPIQACPDPGISPAGQPDAATASRIVLFDAFVLNVDRTPRNPTRSTILQTSPAHAGLCERPDEELGRLFAQVVGTRASG